MHVSIVRVPQLASTTPARSISQSHKAMGSDCMVTSHSKAALSHSYSWDYRRTAEESRAVHDMLHFP